LKKLLWTLFFVLFVFFVVKNGLRLAALGIVRFFAAISGTVDSG
jgi:hypothetical protein